MNNYNCNYVLDDKKVYTILEIISFHYYRHQIGLTIYSCLVIINMYSQF